MTVRTEDPAALTLEELRAVRAELQHEDDVVSYARRVAQARLDLVRAEITHRERGDEPVDLPSELRVVLSQQLTGGQARPPRPTDDLSDDPLARELDAICTQHGFGRLEELGAGELAELAGALTDYERRVSADRRERFERLDALSAELVRRYRDGEASIDGLLGDS
jgi:RsiG-like